MPTQDTPTWVSRPLPASRSNGRGVDPYLQWALTTGFQGYTNLREFSARDPAHDWLSFIARASSGPALKAFFADCAYHGPVTEPGRMFVPEVYTEPVPEGAPPPRIFTGRVRREDLQRLLDCDYIEDFELGLPVLSPGAVVGAATADADDPGDGMPDGRPGGPVIGVIDYGGPFLHRAFCVAPAGPTRFHAVWDQGVRAGLPWHRPAGFGYGREMGRVEIENQRTHCVDAFDGDQMAMYAALGYTLDRDDPRTDRSLRDTHGAHVLHMAAATVDPLDAVREARGGRPLMDNPAGQAPLIFVQLPLPTLVDSSGGSLNVHVLDGVRYILDRAAPGRLVVINISYGQNAGPHDGSSLLEQALDELVAVHGQRLQIVIGAGNQRDDQAHAELRVTDARPQTLRWEVPPKDSTESFLELWYPASIDGLPAGLAVEVRPPGGTWSPAVRAGDPAAVLTAPGGTALAQLVHVDRVPNGAGAMVLLALAPTQAGPDSPREAAPAGVWELRLSTACEIAPVPVHAWIEREDMPDSLLRSQFVDHVSDACTVNGIATGQCCVVVGGIRSSNGLPVAYSGIGPTRDGRGSPSLSAECEESDALQGILAGTMQPGSTLRMRGTSVAAPVAARWLYNRFHAASPRGDAVKAEIDRLPGRKLR